MFLLALFLAVSLLQKATTMSEARPLAEKVIVIGHRGASALRPEHTLASYARAIDDGADFIEPDLVMTSDGVLIARHENEISGTTDVAAHAEFAARRATKSIDGHPATGWFSEDFSLAELKTLRARERLPELRPANARFDGEFEVPSFDEIIAFVANEAHKRGRTIGIYPEIKHSTYFRGIGLAMEEKVLATIRAHRYTAHDAPLFIQSFEIGNLQYLRARLGDDLRNVRLIQLLGEAPECPWDGVVAGRQLTYADMMKPDGLSGIARYADAIGPNKLSVLPRFDNGRLGTPTTLVADAHAQRLLVHPYTFRPENFFLPAGLHASGGPATRNDAGAIAEIRAYLTTGIDGFFTDDPKLGHQALSP